MRNLLRIVFLLLACDIAFGQSNHFQYGSVDPFIGTSGDGNTFPGATFPFGMIQWSPDTQRDGWYHYGDKNIRGFSVTHISGAGCAIYADVPILPWSGELREIPNDYVLPFSHDHEQAHPGYYSVEFGNGITTELTVSSRAGIGRFYFPSGAPRTFIFKTSASARSNEKNRENDSSTVQFIGHDTIIGSVQSGGFCESPTQYTLYFAVKIDKPFASRGAWTENFDPGAASVHGHSTGVYVSFPSGTEPILMKIGLSFVKTENALANLNAEIPGWNFDAIHAKARAAWQEMFDRMQVEGTPGQRTIFYTALYHMLLSPNVFSDENGDYIGFDNNVRRLAPGQEQFANFSDWDIYRSLVQFQSLLLPEQTSQMMQSLVRDAEEGDWLPRWPFANDVSYVMGGDSSAILLSEAYSFGARSFDTKSALRFMLKGANEPGTGLHNYPERPGLKDYITKGYVPLADYQENGASITLEYANADFAVSRFAAAMGDHADAAHLLRRAQNWRSLFDKDGGWIRPRTKDGNWLGSWDPDHLTPRHKNWDKDDQMGFEEGSTWQYTFMLPFNYAGLFRAMGGNEKVIPRLDRFFEKLSGWALPNFTVTNEPDFCTPYAYLWSGNPWKTQQVIDRIRRETFTVKPDGLPGNDDLGATSGVYVWNSLGIYPEIPGVGGFTIGTPMFPRVTMSLGNGSTLEIVSKGDGVYVKSVTVNGKQWKSSWLPLTVLNTRHNQLEFTLQQEPDHLWATKPAEFPPSFGAPKSR